MSYMCPKCGGPGGLLLLFSVAPCGPCEVNERMRHLPPGRTSKDLGIVEQDDTKKKERFVPVEVGQKFPINAKRCGVRGSLSAGASRDYAIASMRKNTSSADGWSWTYKPGQTASFPGIADMGTDESNWI